MERREQYDPEDIEHLLLERPFDQLLEEERAYVLRHLNGEDEYRAMRALLLAMNDRSARPAERDAPAQVRDAVLRAFREEQRPRPAIWLNSIKAWFWPDDLRGLWRPALSFASVASVALVVTVALRVPGHDAGSSTLAELDPRTNEIPRPAEPAPASTSAAEEAAPRIAADQVAPPAMPEAQARQEVPVAVLSEPTATGSTSAPVTNYVPAPFHHATAEAEMASDRTEDLAKGYSTSSAMDEAIPAPSITHQVTSAELATNMSVVSVADSKTLREVQYKKKEKASANGPAVSAEVTPELMALLRATW